MASAEYCLPTFRCYWYVCTGEEAYVNHRHRRQVSGRCQIAEMGCSNSSDPGLGMNERIV
jgi:hypothetical protein